MQYTDSRGVPEAIGASVNFPLYQAFRSEMNSRYRALVNLKNEKDIDIGLPEAAPCQYLLGLRFTETYTRAHIPVRRKRQLQRT